MRIKLFLLFSAFVAIASAQNASLKKMFDKTRWTDGDAFYVASVEGDFINMTGGTCHEGGYAFGLKCTDADMNAPGFSLEKGYWSRELDCEPSLTIPCPQGSNVVAQFTDNDTYLIVEDEQGDAAYCLRKMKSKENLKDVIISQMKLAWTGSYSVSFSALGECPKGSKCEITADKIQLGSWVNSGYRVCEEYESPSNIVRLSNGKYIKIQPHGNAGDLRTSLTLLAVSYDKENEVYGDEHVIMVLDRVRGSKASRWPTDKRLMLPGEITNYPKKELRVMRNEIYARHGYRFSSADLQEYFSGESWYEKDSDPDINNKIHFSIIEFLNISLLKSAENNENLYFPE